MSSIGTVFKSKTSRFIIFTLICVVISTLSVFSVNLKDTPWLKLIWNYFLAIIPVYASLFACVFSDKGEKIKEYIAIILWIIFFPNSLYMITDFMYISNVRFDLWADYDYIGSNLYPWLLLANLIITVGCAIIVGLISLDNIHQLLRERYSSLCCWIIISVVSAVSSFGIYIGRFARLNSWDVINPIKIIDITISVMTPFAPVFILIFTLLTLILYVVYVYLKSLIKDDA